MKIEQDVIAILANCTMAPRAVVLPAIQLDRKLYERVDKVLRAAGGKWNRSTHSHHFEEDATEILDQAILTGEIGNRKQELGIFYTPDALAFRAAQALSIQPGMTLLEPSAGRGALAKAARGFGARVICWDIVPRHVEVLREEGFTAAEGDFMKVVPQGALFDFVLMNPPFSKQEDARHFLHALDFLKPGGRIVAILSASVTFRDTPRYRQIRDLPDISIDVLPEGSFKESGTMVNAALVIFDKPVN